MHGLLVPSELFNYNCYCWTQNVNNLGARNDNHNNYHKVILLPNNDLSIMIYQFSFQAFAH